MKIYVVSLTKPKVRLLILEDNILPRTLPKISAYCIGNARFSFFLGFRVPTVVVQQAKCVISTMKQRMENECSQVISRLNLKPS